MQSTPPSFPDHFSGHADRYAQHRPRYPAALFSWLAERSPGRGLAWDVATGNGQAALALRVHFDRVYATDASAAQVRHAPEHPGVRFAVEPAESPSLPDGSVDLVTVAQALHWFDHARFFAAVQRVLRPGGLFAAWCYELCAIEPAIDAVVLAFYTGAIGPYWPAQRRHIEAGYADLDLPLVPVPAPPTFDMRVRWTRSDFLGYLETWSAVQRYRADTSLDPLAAVAAALAPLWPDDHPLEVRFPLALRLGRRREPAHDPGSNLGSPTADG